ncbi:MAG: purine-nucleoside phosphorylase [Chloroflexota bacterium]|nr:purine-nucleoside phosphorylase [Dehalococcoidia bacterium]MDW8255143.1 purine-nucleoside phosphorylase [Chloroflexota bacterium]
MTAGARSTTDQYEQHVEQAAAKIRALGSPIPAVAIELGSGFSPLLDLLENARRCSYADLPGFPVPTVAGHAGTLALGLLSGFPVLLLAGRAHLYEGYRAAAIALPIRAAARAGVRAVILTNAAGGLADDLAVGDVVVVRDHLNFPGFAGHSPLVDSAGPRFVSLHDAYDAALIEAALAALREAGLRARTGVYAMVAGPSYETPAEIRFLRLAGADVVGMSTLPEVIAARQLGLRVCVLSLVTNISSEQNAVTHAEVVQVSEAALPRLAAVLAALARAAA